MKIYTKTGDLGETGLLGGDRISKTDCRMHAIGTLDELNAAIGVIVSARPQKEVQATLERIQRTLFSIGAQLADVRKDKPEPKPLTTEIHEMEQYIDELTAVLPPLTNFILPGGTATSAHTHLARAICRRTERVVIAFGTQHSLSADVIIYLNRLSDLLFTIARYENFKAGEKETMWHA
ncbi:cob(I)yrinic acid a,c-diamide adenosyltransferase [Candidatus Gracilibacteria bacterium]|nr:cob(I)yrinic acid a,c-diamide adenosyltransferase [Candidatus Gracilibacteria bacterium]